jgi:hypothetical protein
MQMIIKQQAAVLFLQRWIRVKYWRKKRLAATLVLQTWIRRRSLRARKDKEYHAIVYIQGWVREIRDREGAMKLADATVEKEEELVF